MKLVLLCTLLLFAGCASPGTNESSRVAEDEQAIRDYYAQWMKATIEGELELARSLIADGAVFLVPGAGKMDKESFAAAATAEDPNTEFDLDCTIEEIEVLGDHAWLLTEIQLGMTNKRSQSHSKMRGHALSILRREGESWVVVREANTMVFVQ